MSVEYDLYLTEHKTNVTNAFHWIEENLPELLLGDHDYSWQIEFCHDQSKTKPSEYEAYDAYFYGGSRTDKVIEDFRKAWLMHIHRNQHHWQHWVLINDNPEEGEIILDMPYNYIIEMICDWWSFSFKSGNLFEIFDWYEEHKNYIKLSDDTRAIVEDILNRIKSNLEEVILNE